MKLLRARDGWDDRLSLLQADLAAQEADRTPYERLTTRAAALDSDRISPPPLLTGDDLAEMGVPEGKLVGRILKETYRAQLNEQVSTAQEARAWAESLMD